MPLKELYDYGFTPEQKTHRFLVKDADRLTEAVILPALNAAFPEVAVTSESAFAAATGLKSVSVLSWSTPSTEFANSLVAVVNSPAILA